MDKTALALGEHWEQALGDPFSPHARINFHSALALDEQEQFPQEHLDALRELGCFEWFIPACHAGPMRQPEQLVLLGRLVSRRDLTTAIAFGQTMLGSIPVWLAGNAGQKARLSQALQAGQLGCLALTEQAHGSDILANEFTARRDGDGLRLSGAKWLINNGQQGASATVLGRIERPGRAPETALWWLQKRNGIDPQWPSHPKIRTHGIRGADISGFELRDHVVGEEALLRSEEPPIYTVLKTLQISRILCSGFSLGAVDTMFRLTFNFARQRQLYGKAAIEIPVVAARLAQCYARILAADLVAQVAARAVALLPGELSLLSAITKYHVPTEAEDVGRELSVVLGARHFLRGEFPYGLFQKMMRDNQVVSLFDGSTQVNLSLIAGQLRAVSEQLDAADRAGAARRDDTIQRLFAAGQACEGWPAQADLRLSNQGRDTVLEAFFTLFGGSSPEAAGAGPCGQAVAALLSQWSAWRRDCEQATRVERLPHDSVRMMELAQRYVHLHSCAALALGWQINRQMDGSANRLSDDVLICYLAGKLPRGCILAPQECHQRLLKEAAALVDGDRLLSLQNVCLAARSGGSVASFM